MGRIWDKGADARARVGSARAGVEDTGGGRGEWEGAGRPGSCGHPPEDVTGMHVTELCEFFSCAVKQWL